MTFSLGGALARSIAVHPVAASDKAQPRTRAMETSWEIYFRERWMEFVNENFASDEQCAVAFGVTAKQAENWRRGISAPRGHHVARAFSDHPEHAIKLMRRAA